MNWKKTPKLITLSILVGSLSSSTWLTGCATQVEPKQPEGIKIDGSSTVYPITNAVAKEFKKTQNKPISMTVEFSGTGGGFKKFCAGQTDINNASRPIRPEEIKACDKRGIRYYELPVAFDALTVVINPKNDWARNIKITELKKLWEPSAAPKITRWNQIRPEWPNQPITLYGPGKDSGTFDYFTEAVVGEAKASRTDYIASEDDNILVNGVNRDPNALGYFGFGYYQDNLSKLKALPIDNGLRPVYPSRDTVQLSLYKPLARPLFIYVSFNSAQNKEEVRNFVEFYLKKAPQVVETVNYIPLPKEGYQMIYKHFYNGKVGTVFAGKARLDLTIQELLQQEAKFTTEK